MLNVLLRNAATRGILFLVLGALAAAAADAVPDATQDAKPAVSASSKKPVPNPASARYRRSSQRQPSQDRYKQIQQALFDRGYLTGEIDGKWGPQSEEAVKRFQRDQKLRDDGKLGALTLTALGLGPRNSQQASAPATSLPSAD